MKLLRATFILPFVLAACVGQTPQRIIVPRDPVGDRFQEWTDPLETWRIVESQNGTGNTNLPRWVHYFYTGRIDMIEDMERFDERYVFIGRNQGNNFNALRQWAKNFSPEQDLARLIVHRVERRFVAETALYPDDEYGDFFIRVIRSVSNGEFPGAVREEMFWVRREMVSAGDDETYDEPRILERFEYLVLISIDAETLQSQLRRIMEQARASVSPTRGQAAAISNIQQTFFEGF
ncbi:MAG: hypothetical protein FWB79_03970 [Treponema sp.]|nr:hypothetical protein [Treponema sp.]